MQIRFGQPPVRPQFGQSTREQVTGHVQAARKEVQTMSDWGGRQAILQLAQAVEKLNG